MFDPWRNIAKSAEAMFSRWAIKRVCRFLLKKKLGQFILGDIDLDHLDVQLAAGTIHLSDLALNVDYLNLKFGAEAAIYVKEGSIGSLLVTMPWKGKGCQVEVEELELVLAPFGKRDHSCMSRKDSSSSNSLGAEKLERDKAESAVMSASVDVHEGVKTIAKMVKWLLTSFHVKVRKLIVAFDSSSLENEKSSEFHGTLVLRMAEIECGTSISEEFTSDAEATAGNFLGLNRLTNFVKLEGAMLEFLHVNGEENEFLFPCARERTSDKLFSTCCPSRARTPVLTGERGGVSGTLSLSIPWKNGSLDIHKVEADAYIDPLELKFQPSSIKWFLYLWDVVNNVGKISKTNADSMLGSVYFNAASHYSSSLNSSSTLVQNERLGSAYCSPVEKEAISDALLPESQLISDWVPFATNTIQQKNGTGKEPDFGASVEHFFECLDGMRNSQSALGNSGMWSWTCSVFSAITAASSLASGSFHVPCEQQHVETNLRATIVGISVRFSLLDGDQRSYSDQMGDQSDMGSSAHYLTSNFQDIHLVLQVCPQEMNFKATVESFGLTDCFTDWNNETEFGLHDLGNVEGQMLKIQTIQAAVKGVLPPFSSSAKDVGLKKPICRRNCKCMYRDDVVKVSLFHTLGATQFQLTVHSGSSADKFMGPTSFSLNLPPFDLWVNFHLINVVADLIKKIGDSFESKSYRDVPPPKDFSTRSPSSSHGALKRTSHSLSQNNQLRGDVFLPTARIILCFQCGQDGDIRNYYSFHQFIVVDFTLPSPSNEENVRVTTPISNASPFIRNSMGILRSLHFNIGNLDMYLLTPALNVSSELVANKVLSARSRRGHLSVISLHWQEGSVTGPGMVKRAKLLATAEDSKGRRVGRGYEFASVTTARDAEDLSNHTRKDMILGSSFFVHAYLSPVRINLSSSQYKLVCFLLKHAIDELIPENPVKNDSTVSQTSILVECDSAEISVRLEIEESVKCSIEKELPGSWHCFRLQIKKFQLLSVSNIGRIRDANFLWTTHGDGNLWGSITGVSGKELLLISCSNAAMGRGDGEGSNVLSSKFSGLDIIHLWDPDSSHDYISITIRCGTLVAIGGRLDWFERVMSFFVLPSSETDETSDRVSKKEVTSEGVSCESSFVLNLIDVGLSYEPYIKGSLTHDLLNSEFSTLKAQEGVSTPYVACLLAASSVKLSNSRSTDCKNTDYKIIAQGLGLSICTVSGAEKFVDIYSAEHLHKVGYVKAARASRIEAIFRMFSAEESTWELECFGSHIFLDTCHDTTSGLVHLSSQLQQLFAPDLEESFVHLQTRWNNTQKTQQDDETRTPGSSYSEPLISEMDTLHLGSKIDPAAVNLMDEISENEFHFDGCSDAPSSGPEFLLPVDEILNVSDSSQPLLLQETFLEIMEGYFMTEVSPTTELSVEKQSLNGVLENKFKHGKCADAGKVSNGWYGDNFLQIMDDHVLDADVRIGPEQLIADKATTSNSTKLDGCGKVRGRVSFKNINICWKIYAGSDWFKFQKNALHSTSSGGRDKSTCLELVLSGVGFEYKIYPEGDICISRLALSVQDFLLNDNSLEAPWKLVLGYYQSKARPRKSNSKAFKLDLESVRPDPLAPLEEYRLRMAFLPMLLHLHQSQLDFIVSFFGDKGSSVDRTLNVPQDLSERDFSSKDSSTFGVHDISEEALLPYFQKFDLWPVLIRVDYIPSRVDLTALKGGKYVELVNLVPWKGVELKLKHVHAVGVYGWNSVCETIIGEWLEDISQNQVHKLLRGLPPIRSLVAVGSGAKKLVTLPVDSYRKDHRVLKGMQRGITAFLRSVSLEAVGLGVHLAAGAHDILLQAEYILTSIPPSLPGAQCRTKAVRSNQPENARQGIKQACESISDGLGKTATALVRNPLKKYQRGAGAGSALATAIQAAPAAAIAPASATARAVHCALLGMRNSLDPEHKKESMEKYLGASQSPQKYTDG